MPIVETTGKSDAVIWEEHVGYSDDRICYPGMTTCISITGIARTGRVGCHITYGTPRSQIDTCLALLRSKSDDTIERFLVIGALTKFSSETRADMKTRTEIRDLLQWGPAGAVPVYFYDTTRLGSIHLFLEGSASDPDLYWIESRGHIVTRSGYPVFDARHAITNSELEQH